MNIESFVNVLREDHHLFYWFILCLEDDLIDKIPDEEPVSIDDTLTDSELARIIRYFVRDVGDTTIDDQMVCELVEINRMHLRAAEIFHHDLRRFGMDVDMGDTFADIFGSLICERIIQLMSN